VVRELGTRVNSASARIAVDGEPIKLETNVYYAVNKPRGYVSTSFDPAGRPRVMDLLPELPQRIYTVGRLDEESTGLMILTNDGELANRLAHPRYGVEKTYRALVAGHLERETIAKLTAGIWLSDGKVRAKRARIVGRQGQATLIELVLAEGRKREVRRMLAKLGHKVMSLYRIAVGPVTVQGLAAGKFRLLSRYEVDSLRKAASGVEGSSSGFFDSTASSRGQTRRDVPRRRRQPRPDQGLPERIDSPHEDPRSRRSTQPAGPGPRRGGAPHLRPQATGSRPTTPLKPTKGRKPRAGMSGEHPDTAAAARPAPASKGPAHGGPSAKRRIIGLSSGQIASPGTNMRGRPVRRRPPRLKTRPPRAGAALKPRQSIDKDPSNSEDA
jgi:23S rRNA pseudouridine2605 synthase